MKSSVKKYAYNIDTVKVDDKIALSCNHKGCKRFVVAIVVYPTTMHCYVPCYDSSYDMRNQLWYCHQHRP